MGPFFFNVWKSFEFLLISSAHCPSALYIDQTSPMAEITAHPERSVFSLWCQPWHSLEDNIPFSILWRVTMTHCSPVFTDISGELYVQCQCVISLKDRDWCRTDWSHDLGRYWATSSGSSSLKYLPMTLLVLPDIFLVFCPFYKVIISWIAKCVTEPLIKFDDLKQLTKGLVL